MLESPVVVVVGGGMGGGGRPYNPLSCMDQLRQNALKQQ